VPLNVLGVALALIVWQIAAAQIGNPGLFPPIQRVGRAFIAWTRSGGLAADCFESLPRAYFALIIATPIGIGLGLTLALLRPVDAMLNPTVQFIRSLPPVALLPLFVLWFGVDWSAKLGTAVFVCIFPIAITAVQAGKTVNKSLRELAVDLRLSPLAYLSRVVLPGALPSIVPGIRLAAGTSFIMVFVSELAGATGGLGYRISIAQLAYQTDLMLAALFVLGFAGLATDAVITALSGRILHYAGH